MFEYELHDVVGNLGVFFLLLAYLLLQMDKITVADWQYSLLNAFGAGMIFFSLLYAFNLSALIVEGCWIVISVYGLAKRMSSRSSSQLG